MTFLKWSMLIGLLGVLIPILIHLLNRRKAQVVDWGAMKFLLGSLVSRNRRILIEELLLLMLRCLLVALLVLAMARPFVPAGSRVPWVILLPAVLLAAAALGAATILWRRLEWRWTLLGLAGALLLLAAVSVTAERWIQFRRWAGAGGHQDLAIIIDGSASMTVPTGGRTNFDRAVDEARRIIEAIPPSDAVSIIVAGPAPVVRTPAPVVKRADLDAILDELKPTHGAMATLDALNAAVISLAEGQNAAKNIVVITDGQSVGWDTENRVRWEFLARAFDDLPAAPRLVCRTLPLPGDFRNVAVSALTFSRDVLGPDRPVSIEARVENAGTEPVSSFSIDLDVDGRTVMTRRVGRLASNTAETVRFTHRFGSGGLHVVRARTSLNDDLEDDDEYVRVVRVIERLPVLIIDGNPALRPLDRASAYIDIALAPRPEPAEPDDATRPDVLVDTTVVGAPDVAVGGHFGGYRVVVLADVPQLPASVADRLARYVAGGGGLLIAPGSRTLPDFYNRWKTAGGVLLPPGRLGDERALTGTDRHVKPAVSTFSHKALFLLADEAHSDIEAARITGYWPVQLDDRDRTVSYGGMLTTGDPFLVERRLGKGRILMTAVALHTDGTNLPTLQSFVPLVHEMIYYLVRPPQTRWNFAPAGELAVRMVPGAAGGLGGAGGGLRGDYYARRDFSEFVLTRLDPVIQFQWPAAPAPGMPKDGYGVRWTGSVIPRYSETYTFSIRTGQTANLWIDGRQVIQGPRQKSGQVELTAGKRHDLRLEFTERAARSYVQLFWNSPSQSQEIVPAERLSPVRPSAVQIPPGATAEVVRPGEAKESVPIEADGAAVLARVERALRGGLYRVQLPDPLAEAFAGMTPGGGGVPFAVQGDAAESRLVTLSQVERDHVGQHVDFFVAGTESEMVAAVSGDVPGQELWRYLAVGALAVVLAESALARWIARHRKTGAVQRVDFSTRAVDPAAFRSRARELLDAGGPQTRGKTG
jgi:hypothetical protein